MLGRGGVVVADELDLDAVAPHRGDLDRRRGAQHDAAAQAEPGRRVRDALRVIAAEAAITPAVACRRVELRDPVVGAAS